MSLTEEENTIRKGCPTEEAIPTKGKNSKKAHLKNTNQKELMNQLKEGHSTREKNLKKDQNKIFIANSN